MNGIKSHNFKGRKMINLRDELTLGHLSLTNRVLFSGFLFVIGIGLLMSGLQILLTHGMADGEPGLSKKDIVYSFYGNPSLFIKVFLQCCVHISNGVEVACKYSMVLKIYVAFFIFIGYLSACILYTCTHGYSCGSVKKASHKSSNKNPPTP